MVVARQAQTRGDARLEDAGHVLPGAGAARHCDCGEPAALGFQERDERVLAVAGDEEGVVMGEERDEVREAEAGGLCGVVWGVD